MATTLGSQRKSHTFAQQSPPDPKVRRVALEAFLITKPIITFAFDGSKVEKRQFFDGIEGSYQANVDKDKKIFVRVRLGNWIKDQRCYGVDQWESQKKCIITVNSDGVFFNFNTSSMRLSIEENGYLKGSSFFNIGGYRA